MPVFSLLMKEGAQEEISNLEERSDVNHTTDLAPLRDAVPLAGTGIRLAACLHANLAAPALVAHSLRKGEGRLSAEGAIIVRTGVHTGRSVGDKFVVDEPATTAEVWWGKVNQKLPVEKFAALKGRVQAYLQGRELFTQDLYAGADPANRIRVRLVTTGAWQALFARNMFIRPPAAELAGFVPDYVILHAPEFEADPVIDGVKSSTADRAVLRGEDDRDRGDAICRRDQEIDFYGDELDFAGARRAADALQRQYRAWRRIRRCFSACRGRVRRRCPPVRTGG